MKHNYIKSNQADITSQERKQFHIFIMVCTWIPKPIIHTYPKTKQLVFVFKAYNFEIKWDRGPKDSGNDLI